jgi:hypothetical protein
MLHEVFLHTHSTEIHLKLESSHTRPSGQKKHHPLLATSIQSSYALPVFGVEHIIDNLGRIMNTMLSLSVPVDQVYEQPSGLPKLDSTRRVYPSSFQREVIRWPHREVSMLRWGICTRMTGDGTCMTLSKVQIGSEIKMLFTI